MKKILSGILTMAVALSILPVGALNVKASDDYVEPMFIASTSVGGMGSLDRAIKNDGSMWTFDIEQNPNSEEREKPIITTEKLQDNVRYIEHSPWEDYYDATVYYIIKRDNSLWRVKDPFGTKRGPVESKIMDDAKLINVFSPSSIANGFYVIKNDGTLWAWGSGRADVPGAVYEWKDKITDIPVTTPTQILSDVVSVSEYERMYAVKSDNTLWSWGFCTYVLPGEEKGNEYAYPQKVMDDVKQMSGRFILRTDDNLYISDNGTLVKVLDGVRMVADGYAVKHDNTMWRLEATNGQIDLVQVLDNVKTTNDGIALKFDGSLWSPGSSYYSRNTPFKIMQLCAFSIEGESQVLKDKETVLRAYYYDEYGNKTEDSNVTWYCDSNGEVSVSPLGNSLTVRGLMDGKAKITAVHNPTGEIAQFEIEVISYQVNLSGQYSVLVNGSREIQYSVTKGGIPVPNSEVSVNWSIEANENKNSSGDVIKISEDKADSGVLRRVRIDGVDEGKCDLVCKIGNAEIARAKINSVGDVFDVIEDESIIMARVLADNNRFEYYRNEYNSPADIYAENIDVTPAKIYNKLNKLFKKTDKYTEYYEAILTQLVVGNAGADGTNILYNITDAKIAENMSLMLSSAVGGDYEDMAKVVEKINNGEIDNIFETMKKNYNNVVEATKAGTNKLGFSDALSALFTLKDMGKATSEAAAQMTAMGVVANSKIKAIEAIMNNTDNKGLKKACENVIDNYKTSNEKGAMEIANKASQKGMAIGEEKAKDFVFTALIANSPLVLYKGAVDISTSINNMLMNTDDLSSHSITIAAYSEIEDVICKAIESAQKDFSAKENFINAEEFMALADMYKEILICGCETVGEFVKSTENASDKVAHFVWGDYTVDRSLSPFKTPDYKEAQSMIGETKKTLTRLDFYMPDIDIAAYIGETRSTECSDWAKSDIERAKDLELLPPYMEKNYTEPITRAEFCTLITQLVEKKTGKGIVEVIEESGIIMKSPFEDSYYEYVDYIYKLGIVNGVGGNNFEPLGEITREQAATMLQRTAEVLGFDTAYEAMNEDGISEWAKDGVGFVSEKGIMKGTGNGFEPQGKYTKEQAILTFVRMYDTLK